MLSSHRLMHMVRFFFEGKKKVSFATSQSLIQLLPNNITGEKNLRGLMLFSCVSIETKLPQAYAFVFLLLFFSFSFTRYVLLAVYKVNSYSNMSPLTTPRRNQTLPICRYGSTCFKIKNILMMYFLLWIKQKPTSAAQQVDRAESRQRSGVVRRASCARSVRGLTHHTATVARQHSRRHSGNAPLGSLAFADAGSVRSGTHPVFFGFV